LRRCPSELFFIRVPVEIISVGSEFIIPDGRNQGIPTIATLLLEIGIEVDYVSSVCGQEERIEEVLRHAIERANLIFVIGGVGSGEYDMSKKLATRVLKKRLVLNYKVLDAITAQYARHGEEMPRAVEKMALVPTDAELLENEKGEVPGFLFTLADRHVVLLPSNAAEIETMLKTLVLPRIDPKTFRFGAIKTTILKTCGLPLNKIKDAVKGLEAETRYHLLNYVTDGEETSIIVTVRGDLQKDVDSRLEQLLEQLRKKLGKAVYGVGADTLEAAVGRLCTEKQATLALAESCTGGLIAHKLTNISGSSAYLERGVVVYSNTAKIALLDVSPNLIETHGAVSAETAVAMAEGIRWIAQTTYGLAVTGIAGPTGGTVDKPVGLVYLAITSELGGTQWRRCQFTGDRLLIKTRTAQTALDMLRQELLK